ncbi:MAG: S-layer homology domain-containing protein, partial [Bacillota bacterium]
MLKKLIVLLLCLVLVIPAAVLAEEDELPVLEKPVSLGIRNDRDITMIFRLTQPDSIMKLMEEYYIACEIDWKINDGPWQTEKNWEGVFLPNGLWSYYEETFGDLEVFHEIGSLGHDDRNSVDIPIHYWSIGLQSPYDLQNNTYSFRYRYIFDYPAQDPATGEWGYMVVTSPYSNVVTVGKSQGGTITDKLEAPANLKGELKTRGDTGMPYFYFMLDIPKSVEEANKAVPVSTYVDWKIGNGKWAIESGDMPFAAAGHMLTDALEGDPVDEGKWGEIDIKKNTYYFRAYFEFKKPDGTVVRSPFSNIVEIGTPAFYSGASNWAKPELQRAYDLGLIPDILKGADMTKPINREEFAEIAVLLYENLSGKKAAPASPNPFTDTNNPQILKAYNLGITSGTSKTTFSPKELINREQCATMLFRAIKAVYPQGDYSVAGVKDFPDQKHISSWAVEATKYMSKIGVITGDAKGNFMPKAVTKAEEAAGYGMATREQAIAL